MTHTAILLPSAANSRYFGPATVVETSINGEPKLFRVDIQGHGGPAIAQMVIEMTHNLEKNDEVLVAGEDIRHLFVIGVIRTAAPPQRRQVKVQIDGGAHATVNDRKLEVYSDQGELIFEYQPSKGTARVHSNTGNLDIAAPDGNLSLACGKALHMQAEDVRIEGNHAVNLEVRKTSGLPGSSVMLGDHRLQMNAPELQATAQRGLLYIQETRYIGKTFMACVDQIQWVANQMETLAQSVIEKAKDVFRTVTNCYQLSAKRKRSLIETTSHTKARNIIFKSDEDFKVKGDQIHLG